MINYLYEILNEAKKRNALPKIVAYNRIDGPGSSLDLREFQQALWTIIDPSSIAENDETAAWSRSLPRTIGITIDTGTSVEVQPFDQGFISVRSVEYRTDIVSKAGEVPPTMANWLLRIIDVFGLSGVRFVLHNLRPGIQSSGLGGSATAATAVAILANKLSGNHLGPIQLISLASRMEQDSGISYTGTQEQSNVVFGGIVDYIWFPWGIPDRAGTTYGSSIRYELLSPDYFSEVEARMAIFHTGIARASADVNQVWIQALFTHEGYMLHKEKLRLAYEYREALRKQDWENVIRATNEYREIRTSICPSYMDGAAEILGFANAKGCGTFPLGAGGGGTVLIVAPDPDTLKALRMDLKDVYREIKFRVMPKGHQLYNMIDGNQ